MAYAARWSGPVAGRPGPHLVAGPTALAQIAHQTMIRIISGGQTGADQAALDAAIALGLPHGGWLPRGRKTESGPLPPHYSLRELRSARYREAFAAVEIDLLRIAAVLKHPSFREEKEWRIVSPVIANTAGAPILFREGHAMLVPYIEFDLGLDKKPPVLDHLYLGPTANVNISMNSLKMFLEQHGIVPKRGIDYCQIPFRQR